MTATGNNDVTLTETGTSDDGHDLRGDTYGLQLPNVDQHVLDAYPGEYDNATASVHEPGC